MIIKFSIKKVSFKINNIVKYINTPKHIQKTHLKIPLNINENGKITIPITIPANI